MKQKIYLLLLICLTLQTKSVHEQINNEEQRYLDSLFVL